LFRFFLNRNRQMAAANNATGAWVAQKVGDKCEHSTINNPDLGPTTVEVQITHCGVCHTDCMLLSNLWGVSGGVFPMCAGHEGVGLVTATGAGVKSVKVGDRVGVGFLRDCCGGCGKCLTGDNNLCNKQTMLIFSGPGCFADKVRVDQMCTTKIPEGVKSEDAAPLLCAGATVWNPLQRLSKIGDRVAIVGIGALGHLAIQFAAKLGRHVTAFSSNPDKATDAKKFGAMHFVCTKDEAAMKAEAGKYAMVLFCAAEGDIGSWFSLLEYGGNIVVTGLPTGGGTGTVPLIPVVFHQKGLVGSYVSGAREMKEMFDFVAANPSIKAQSTLMPFSQINEALAIVMKGEARYKIVLHR